MANILVMHGPNMNLLGTREPAIYGVGTLCDLHERLQLIVEVQTPQHQLLTFQDNAEHRLIERIHRALIDQVEFILFNPAAFTHTSIAIRDALLAVNIPFIEIHLSNISKRESFRHHSYFSDIAVGVISGLGLAGFEYGLSAAISRIST